MKCPYQTIATHKPERFGYDAQDITTFGECCETECPFYYLSGKIERCRKAVYNKGYDDGREALAYHYKLCKEEGSIITVPDGATNGDMIKAMFPDAEIEYHYTFVRVIIKTIGDNYVSFNYDVWNSLYRKEQE